MDNGPAGPGSGSEQDSSVLTEVIQSLYLRFLSRSASAQELGQWLPRLRDLGSFASLVQLLQASAKRSSEPVRTTYPAGHFFSPVVDPGTVRDYVTAAMGTRPEQIGGIDLDIGRMRSYWRANEKMIATTSFTEEPDGRHRYYYRGGPYPYGDAIMLRVIIGAQRPRRIVEIGSGFSTACMLDAAEEFGLEDVKITCIEPYAARLRSVLRPEDRARVEILEEKVQGMPLERFQRLEPNDILFIDSTHVLKTGSDVHYELFHILPVMRPGVLVHFHDCRYPFEYPAEFIFERNYSWNEAYAVRAFLMYNSRFRVFFYNSLFARECRDMVAATCPVFLRNPGSSLWLLVQ
jgi:predicted O-methyltransferase YrrM